MRHLITFTPPSGMLSPMHSGSIVATFNATTIGSYKFVVRGTVGGGDPVYIGVVASVQEAMLTPSVTSLAFGAIYAGVTGSTSLVLVNNGELPASFTLTGSDSLVALGIVFTCSATTIEGGQSAFVTIDITPTAIGPFTGTVHVHVQGRQDHPIVLPVSGTVCGLQLSASLSPPALVGAMSTLSVHIHSSRRPQTPVVEPIALSGHVRQTITATVYITNHTSISAELACAIENYFAPTVSEPLARTLTTLRHDFSSTGKSKSTNGIAIAVTPSTVAISPFASVAVTVTATADVWGQFSDTLVLSSGDYVLRVPVSVRVVGCPLEAQLTAASLLSPMLHMPAIALGASVTRELHVRNASPFAVTMHWDSYIVKADDPQLLDLVCVVDEAGVVSLRTRVHEGISTAMSTAGTKTRMSMVHGDFASFGITPDSATISPLGTQTFTVTFTPLQGGRSHGFFRGVVDMLGTPAAPMDAVAATRPADITEEDVSLQVFVDGMGVAPSLVFETASTVVGNRIPHGHVVSGGIDGGAGGDGRVAAPSPGLAFETPLSKFLDKSVLQRRYVLVRNPTAAQTTFTVRVEEPFSLLDPALVAANGECLLAPSGALTIGVGCTFAADMWLPMFSPESGGNASVSIERAFHAQSSMLSQTLPLRATVYRGALVAPATCDLGKCLVGGTATVNIPLTNSGFSALAFHVAVPAPFSCFPQTGSLEAHYSNVSDNW